jgi:hypothetical protein
MDDDESKQNPQDVPAAPPKIMTVFELAEYFSPRLPLGARADFGAGRFG